MQNGNTLFMPVAGLRYNSDVTLYNIGDYGYYWSSMYSPITNAYLLAFSSSVNTGNNAYNEAYGFSVRCVAE